MFTKVESRKSKVEGGLKNALNCVNSPFSAYSTLAQREKGKKEKYGAIEYEREHRNKGSLWSYW